VENRRSSGNTATIAHRVASVPRGVQMSKHTPGPWHWVNSSTNKSFDFDAEWDGEGKPSLRTIAEQRDCDFGWTLPDWILDADPMQYGNDTANARLIASAPDLLEALKLAVRQNDHDMLMNGEELRVCRAAIAKAEGAE